MPHTRIIRKPVNAHLAHNMPQAIDTAVRMYARGNAINRGHVEKIAMKMHVDLGTLTKALRARGLTVK